MNWYEDTNFQKFGKLKLWSGDAGIFINEQNIKPNWIEHAALNSEFHIRRNKKNLLIVIGESWTYGESLRGIASALQKYSLYSQLESCFGSRMAMILDSDYYQYAIPGNCNAYMFLELDRILDYVKQFNYEEVYVCIQLTEPGREKAADYKILKDTPFENLYNISPNTKFTDWLKEYDELFFDFYNQKILKHKDSCNIKKAMLWKNFCRSVTDKRDYCFDIIETSWIQYSAKYLGVNLDMPDFYSIGWLDSVKEEYQQFKFDSAWLLDQIDMIEKSNDYLKDNPMHYPHPNETAHALWAQFLLRKANWIDGI